MRESIWELIELTRLGMGETSISRARLFILARIDNKVTITSPHVWELAEKVSALSKEVSRGELLKNEDILEKALGNKDHPSRVRGVGIGVTRKQIVGEKKAPKKDVNAELEALKARVAQ